MTRWLLTIWMGLLLAACEGHASPPMDVDAGDPWAPLGSGIDERPENTTCTTGDAPPLLSDHPCFPTDPEAPTTLAIPYDVLSPLWSDGLEKDRYIAIPDGELIHVRSNGSLELPVGSVLIKIFRDDERLIETRLLTVVAEDEIEAFTYVWNEEQTDALRMSEGGNVEIEGGTWAIPTETQCFECHTSAADTFLGLRIAQLNRDLTYEGTGRTANQIATWVNIDLLDGSDLELPSELDRLAAPEDPAAELENRARAYLDANCAHCHQPGATGAGTFDLRIRTSLAFSGLCNALPEFGDPIEDGSAIIAPGAPERSVAVYRMQSADPLWRMPRIGSAQVDEVAVALVSDWVESLTDCD